MPESQTSDVGLILVSVPFVLQLVACVVAYLARDGATGATVGLLSTSLLSLGLVHLVSRQEHERGPGVAVVVGAVLALSAAAAWVGKPLPAAVLLIAALRFALAGIYELSAVGFWQSAAGLLGLVATAGAGYCVLAFDLEDQRHREVLPTVRRSSGLAAGTNGGADPVDGLSHEAGVRRPS